MDAGMGFVGVAQLRVDWPFWEEVATLFPRRLHQMHHSVSVSVSYNNFAQCLVLNSPKSSR